MKTKIVTTFKFVAVLFVALVLLATICPLKLIQTFNIFTYYIFNVLLIGLDFVVQLGAIVRTTLGAS